MHALKPPRKKDLQKSPGPFGPGAGSHPAPFILGEEEGATVSNVKDDFT